MYSFSDCLAHPPDDYLRDHLRSVATANQSIWGRNSSSFTIASILTDLVHDIGKANRWFQDRVHGKTEKKSKHSNHSLLSAVMGWYLASAVNLVGDDLNWLRLSVFVSILRHHSNLKESWVDEITLLKQKLEANYEDYSALLNAQLSSMDLTGIGDWLEVMVEEFDLPMTVPELDSELIIKSITSTRTLRLRGCFRKLESAIDFLCVYSGLLHFDKIHAATGAVDRQRFHLPENAVKNYISTQIPKQDNELTKIRKGILVELEREILDNTDEHFFTVTAPTGSGKTLAILNATLKLRECISEKEGVICPIIYCLPFTSIIDQNYTVYHSVLENSGLSINSELILKHHHLSDPVYTSSDPEFDTDDSELFTETWRSELVVTTFHQLLYSILSPRNRNLKRFVSLKNAIVIMDEVQAISHRYWSSIRRLFRAIGDKLNTRFILMTATQPLLFTKDMAIELLPDHDKYFKQLSRIVLINKTDTDTLLECFADHVVDEIQKNPNHSRMCILNRKSSVIKLLSLFNERLVDRKIYALSTNLTPKDRKRKIEEIKLSLEKGEPCLIVTTQLVEAGVDISVDVVDRDIAPLDSIIQSAGRCNRHNSEAKGIVNLWSLSDGTAKLWSRVYDPFLIDTTREVLFGKQFVEERDFLDLGMAYFNLICERSELSNIDELILNGDFSEIEAHFKLIEDDGPRQSYFIIRDAEDKKIWTEYEKLNQIDDKTICKKTFNRFKAEFMERIVQVRTRESVESVIPIVSSTGLYSEKLGFLENTNRPESLILL